MATREKPLGDWPGAAEAEMSFEGAASDHAEVFAEE